MQSKFTLDSYRQQLEQIVRPGVLQRMLGLVPDAGKMTPKVQSGELEREFRRLGGIIDSMTLAERSTPNAIDLSRRQRIANGSGVSVQEVVNLLHQFDSMSSLMEQIFEGAKRDLIDKMQKLRRGEPLDLSDDDEPWTDRDILQDYDDP